MNTEVLTNCVLPKTEALDVVEYSLQLRVKHQCGTAHSYSVVAAPGEDLPTQLAEDVGRLAALADNLVHEGAFEIDGRVYIATEVDNHCDPLVESLLNTVEPLKLMPEPPAIVEEEEEVVVEPEPEVEIVYPDIQSEPESECDSEPEAEVVASPKPKRGRRKKHERVEPNPEPSEPTSETKQHYVSATESSEEDTPFSH